MGATNVVWKQYYFLSSLEPSTLSDERSLHGCKVNLHDLWYIKPYRCAQGCSGSSQYSPSIILHNVLFLTSQGITCDLYHTSVTEVEITICVSCATGIGLTLNGVQYTNNSVVTITHIGTGSAALICATTRLGCCLSTDGSHWYLPDGSYIQRSETQPYYRTRTILERDGSATVRLNRNPGATTTGVFHCDILDASGDLQSIYVGIYTATTGESSEEQ